MWKRYNTALRFITEDAVFLLVDHIREGRGAKHYFHFEEHSITIEEKYAMRGKGNAKVKGKMD